MKKSKSDREFDLTKDGPAAAPGNHAAALLRPYRGNARMSSLSVK